MQFAIALLTVFAAISGSTTGSDLTACPAILCFANACHVQKCHAQLQATCEAGCNGCIAKFKDAFGNYVTDKCGCSPGVKPKTCNPDPCTKATCYNALSQCRTDTCGTCRAVFYDHNANEIPGCTTEDPSKGICPPLPPGTIGHCAEMCGQNTCPPPQLCCSNGCGHVCKDPYFPGDDPSCPMLPPDVKGLCVEECSSNADCYPVKKCCSTGCGHECRTPFPGECNSMLCIVNQCSVQSCATHTQAKCLSACNTCVALFVDKFGNYIGEKCNCPGRIFEADCEDDLCDDKKCPADTSAECRINRCGGCNTAFFDRNGKEVDCDKPSGGGKYPNFLQYFFWLQFLMGSMGTQKPPTQSHGCPAYPPPGPTICLAECSTDSDCLPGQKCCSYGCRTTCTSTGSPGPYLDPSCPPVPLGQVGNCWQECSSNADCGQGQICCSSGCGTQCTHRLPKTDDRCPSFGTLPVNNPPNVICPAVLPQCYSNSDCKQWEICCSTSDGCTTVCRAILDPKCPQVPEGGTCMQQCSFNTDCGQGGVCCSNGCGTYCHQTAPVTDARCPPNDGIGPCINLCSSNSDCQATQVCCKVGCGTQCRDIGSGQDKRCPPPDPDILAKLPYMTCPAASCVDNSQCPNGKICCNDGCSSQCVNIPGGSPGGSYDARCPLPVAPVSQVSCVYQCSSNSDCKSNYMCCGLYCGSHCTPKPSQPCNPGEFLAPCHNACDDLQLTCPNYPSAQCWVYGCNGCKTEFYDEHNRIVKNCNNPPPPFPIG